MLFFSLLSPPREAIGPYKRIEGFIRAIAIRVGESCFSPLHS